MNARSCADRRTRTQSGTAERCGSSTTGPSSGSCGGRRAVLGALPRGRRRGPDPGGYGPRRTPGPEVPVVVFRVDGLADHVRRAGPGEEVVVLVGVRGQGRQDRRVDVGLVAREERLVAEVHQRLVGVVTQELLHVLGQADAVVEVLRVLDLVVVQLEEAL